MVSKWLKLTAGYYYYDILISNRQIPVSKWRFNSASGRTRSRLAHPTGGGHPPFRRADHRPEPGAARRSRACTLPSHQAPA